MNSLKVNQTTEEHCTNALSLEIIIQFGAGFALAAAEMLLVSDPRSAE